MIHVSLLVFVGDSSEQHLLNPHYSLPVYTEIALVVQPSSYVFEKFCTLCLLSYQLYCSDSL
jgi:hypothetical protein